MGKVIIPLIVLLGISLIGIGSISEAFALTSETLWSCAKNGSNIFSVNSTGQTDLNNTISIDIGSTGFDTPIVKCLGLATDPTDGQMYMIARDSLPVIERFLLTIDPTTGSATVVEEFIIVASGFDVSHIAFDSTGQMFGTESTTQDTGAIHKINKATAIVTTTAECNLATIASGFFGGFALNHDDNTLYVLHKETAPFDLIKIDLNQANCEGTRTALTGYTIIDFPQDMTYDTTTSKFVARSNDNITHDLPTFGTDGVTTNIGNESVTQMRGLAFALDTAPPLPTFGNPIHFYALNGTTTDDFGGNSIVLSDGGTGLNATGWNFLEADKATLASSIDEFEYGIEVVWSFKESSGFRRILDWHNFTGSVTNADSDFGLYRASIGLYEFFDNSDPTCGTITANQTAHFLVQRNATSALVELYADGSLCTSFTDSDPEYLFDQATQLITFFKDDGVEDSDGFVDCIAIYDKPMNASSAITTTTNTSACFTASAIPTPFTVNLLDVFKSSSTTLESGTPICLDVDLTSASACGSELLTNEIYRFEVEVSNTSGVSKSPTSLVFNGVVGLSDVLGTINANSILSSGCSTNTDWTDSISGGTDVTLTSGTTCAISASGTEEFWFTVKIGSNADDDTGTFTITDGVDSDTSTTTSFTVNTTPPPATTCSDESCPEPTHYFPLNCNGCNGVSTGDLQVGKDILENDATDAQFLSGNTFVGAYNKTGVINGDDQKSAGSPNNNSGLDEFEYGIEMIFAYTSLSSAPSGGALQIIDFHNDVGSVANSDPLFGLYADAGTFTFFDNTATVGYGENCGSYSAGERKHLLMQRNATSELVELFVDGQLCTSFTDSEPEFTLSNDQITTLSKGSSFLDCVLYYDDLFTTAQAQVLTKTGLCPEVPIFSNPSSLYLLNGLDDLAKRDSALANHLNPIKNHDGTTAEGADSDLPFSDLGIGLNGTGWNFLAGSQLSVSNFNTIGGRIVIDEFNYGIEMVFEFDTVTQFRRVLDWHNFVGSTTNADSEFGLYTTSQQKFTFFDNSATVGYGSDCGSITANVPVHILVQRNSTSELVELYVDGALCTSFTDSEPEFTFDVDIGLGEGNQKVTFFKDDGGEESDGFIQCFALYDGVMPSADAITTTAKFGQCFNGNDSPVLTLNGDSQVALGLDEPYLEQGATCDDTEEGSLTVIIGGDTVFTNSPAFFTITYDCVDTHSTFPTIVTSGLSTDRFGVSGTKFETIPIEEQNATQLSRLVVVAGGGTAGVGGGVTGGSPVAPITILTTEEQQAIDEAFDQAVQDAIDALGLQEGNIVETILQTFFEFTVVDTVHEEIQLNSFLVNERLGIRWTTGDDIIITSVTPASSPFLISFEVLPVIKQGSGLFASTNFLNYNLLVQRNECSAEITMDCVQKLRYEIPVTVNALINGTNVSDIGTITVDLTEDEIDIILVLILATFGLPLIAGLVQRSRGRSGIPPVRDVFNT